MVKCYFCKNDLPLGSGILFSRRDGSAFYFCSSKCERNFNLKRNPHKLKWVVKKKVKKSKETAATK